MNITGTNSGETLTGTIDDDVINALGGSDSINGSQGNDIVDGGAGTDRLTFALSNSTRFALPTGPQTYLITADHVTNSSGSINTAFTAIERFSFFTTLAGNFDDTIDASGIVVPNTSTFVLQLQVGNGNNLITGSNYGDLITLGTGSNSVNGGGGVDEVRVNFANGSGATLFVGGSGGTIITSFGDPGQVTTNTITNTESIYLFGTDAADATIDASGVTGYGGQIAFIDHNGSDTMIGQAGKDFFSNNYLNVLGHDVFTGNGGADTYDYTFAVNGMDGDTITDFDADDVIDLTFNNASQNGGGLLANHFIGAAAFSGTAGEYRFQISGGTTLVQVDTNGDGATDETLTLSNGAFALSESALGSNFLKLGNRITGTSASDTFFATSGNDTINGLGGNDFLIGNGGDDVLNGGAGVDWAAFYTDDPAIGGTSLSLLLQGTAQNSGHGWVTMIDIENLVGTAFSDVLIGDANDNVLSGGGGFGAVNDDTLDGGGGNDLLIAAGGSHMLAGGTGNDTVRFAEALGGVSVSLSLLSAQETGHGSWTLSGVENLSGGTGTDRLEGDSNANILAGDGGDDSLLGGAGNDTLFGDGRIDIDTPSGVIFTAASGYGSGNDLLDGGPGNDVLNGGDGSDTAGYASATAAVQATLNADSSGGATGGGGSDSFISIENLLGSTFNDILTGNGADNVLTGGDGNDLLVGGAGNDRLDGGGGFDRANYAGASAGVTVDLRLQGSAQNTVGNGFDTLVGIEHVGGTAFSDLLTGDDGDNWLSGGVAGNSVNTSDTIAGGNGNDLVQVGGGTHVVSGGAGVDTLSLAGWSAGSGVNLTGVTVSLASQGGVQSTGHGSINATGFENLSGSTYNDTLTGDQFANIILGGGSHDTLNGGDGNDILYGDGMMAVSAYWLPGTDSGPVTLYPETAFGIVSWGNDTLKGDRGDDELHGGKGADKLTGGAGNDRFVIEAESGHDRVTDFTSGEKIVFDSSSGVTSFSQLVLTSSGGDTMISWGSAGNDILLAGVRLRALSAADFQFDPAPAFQAQQSFAANVDAAPTHDIDLSIMRFDPHTSFDLSMLPSLMA